MSCAYFAAKELFRKEYIPFPRGRKFQRLADIIANDYEKYTAKDCAKALSLLLRRLDKGNFINHAFVFVHPSDKARGYDAESHCLGLYRQGDDIKRYCLYERNTRYVFNHSNGFTFTTRDWTTSIKQKYVEKPFRFSYFITRCGYSIWVTPKKVLNVMDWRNYGTGSIQHGYPYHESWEAI